MISVEDFTNLKWTEQARQLRLLDNMASNCEGKTEGIANKKRKPFIKHYKVLQKIHNGQWLEFWKRKEIF